MADFTGGTNRPEPRILMLGGERFSVANDPKTKAPMWTTQYIPAQDADWKPEVSISLPTYAQGYGFSWEGIAGTYSHADGWDASTPGKLTPWPLLASGQSFTTALSQGWLFQLGSYIYAARGRYVVKYKVDGSGADWDILEIHDLGSGITCAGRPGLFGGKAYIPRRTGTTGDLEIFHELTTVATTSAETQHIVISGTPTGGTYTLTFDGKTTAAIAYNAAAADVQSALRLVAALDLVTVTDTGTTPNFTHSVLMTGVGGDLGNSSPPQMTATDSTTGGTHAIAVTTTTAGTTDTWTAGPSGREMRCFIAFQDKMYGASGNQIYSVSADPLTDGDWAPSDGNGYTVGDSDQPITDLAIYVNLLVVGKTDGLYTFDTGLQTVDELPDLRFVIDDSNAVGMTYAGGFILVPHRTGLIRWQPGSYLYIGPNQEGAMESDLTPGWGRVTSGVPYGKYTFVTANDYSAQLGNIASLVPATTQGRGPVVPHMHQQTSGAYEAVTVASEFTQPIEPSGLTTWTDDNTIGASGWANPTTVATDGAGFAASGNATSSPIVTDYLKGEQLQKGTIPSEATVTGIKILVKRKARSNT